MKISYKILIPLTVFFILLIAGVSLFLKKSVNSILITEEFLRLTENVEKDIQRLLAPDDFMDALSPDSYRRFQAMFASVNSSLVARIRIWDTGYQIVFSDLKKEIGFQNSAHTDIQRVLREETPFVIIKTKDINEPAYEGEEEFSDVYIPVRFAGRAYGAVEIHLTNASVVGEVAKEINLMLWGIAAGALILFAGIFGIIHFVVLSPLKLLQKNAGAIGAGNFDVPVTVYAKDEIGALAVILREMAQKLKNLFSVKEQHVVELAAHITTIEKQKAELERFQRLTVGRELKMIELKKENERLRKTAHAARALVVSSARTIAAGTTEISFERGGFDFQAGQYARFTLPQLRYEDNKGNSRNFSIVSSPHDARAIAIAFRDSESGFKRTLLEMAAGSPVEIDGPFGSFVLPQNCAQPAVFLAGGIGITPCLSIIRFASEQKSVCDITLVYANKNKERAAYLTELETLAAENPRFHARNIFGIIGTEEIKNATADPRAALWFVVGPPAMVTDMRSKLKDAGVSDGSIYFEEFGGYA